ncbi:MAG: peptidase C14, partial [Chitinophagaceae bacterium]
MRKFFALAIGLLAAAGLGAQTTQPILRLETGMHAAAGKALGIDAAGKYLLTTSDDRTARLWDAATGRQLRVFRVPAEGSTEGKLYAGTLSADGRLAIVGGQTGYAW